MYSPDPNDVNPDNQTPATGGAPDPTGGSGSGGQSGSLNPVSEGNPDVGAIPVGGISTPVPETVAPLNYNQYVQQSVDLSRQAITAQEQVGKANQEKAKRDAAFWQGMSDADRQEMIDRDHWVRQFDDQHKQGLANDQLALNEAKKANIDPDHWWNSKDTGGKIAAGIGIILGGIGQGMSMVGPNGNKNATNLALGVVEKSINNDIDSQKENMKQKWNAYKVQHELSDSQDNYNKFKILDNHQQYLLAHQVFLDQLQQSSAMAADPIAKANADIAINQTQQKILDEQRGMGKYAEDLSAQQQSAVAAELRRQQERQDKIAKDTQASEDKDYEIKLTQNSKDREKASEEFIKHSTEWSAAAKNAAANRISDLEKERNDIEGERSKQLSARAKPKENSNKSGANNGLVPLSSITKPVGTAVKK